MLIFHFNKVGFPRSEKIQAFLLAAIFSTYKHLQADSQSTPFMFRKQQLAKALLPKGHILAPVLSASAAQLLCICRCQKKVVINLCHSAALPRDCTAKGRGQKASKQPRPSKRCRRTLRVCSGDCTTFGGVQSLRA